MTTTLRSVGIATILAGLVPGLGATQTPEATVARTPEFRVQVWGETGGDFTVRLAAYFELRRRLQSELPAVIVTDDVRHIRRGTRSLAHAIRLARKGAVRGEFFTAATSAEFRRVLSPIMNARVWAAIMDDNPGTLAHRIDGSYPDGKTLATTPGVILTALPSLPDDIQFRFVGRHLILYDVRANTIIDLLPDAIGCARKCGK